MKVPHNLLDLFSRTLFFVVIINNIYFNVRFYNYLLLAFMKAIGFCDSSLPYFVPLLK